MEKSTLLSESCRRTIILFTCLYSVVKLPDIETGEMFKRYTYAMVTRAANSLMAIIHNDGDNAGRMPLYFPFLLL